MTTPTLGSSSARGHTVLIIEDEAPIRRTVAAALLETSDRVLEAADAEAGLALAEGEHPELVVLDLGLPDREGLDVCRELRSRTAMPIVVLSARHSESEKVELLNAGADDYITKPFGLPELVARVRAQLRRAQSQARARTGPADAYTIGDLLVDLGGRTVRRHGEAIHLTPTEFAILRALVEHVGRTRTHQQIYDAVWGRPFGNPQQYLRVFITNLRRKIELDAARPQLIITEPGVGYRLEA